MTGRSSLISQAGLRFVAFCQLPVHGVELVGTQFWWTRSLSLAPPSAVVPFNYLSLVWAMILDFAVWGDVPTSGLLVGSAIVIASGLYILLHVRTPLAAGRRRIRTIGPPSRRAFSR